MFAKNFSLWCDFIEREFLRTEFQAIIQNKNIKGATSNPAIFQKAFNLPAYKPSINFLIQEGLDHKEIYEAIAVDDIKQAAKILRPLFDENPQNGWVSIEIDPFLADNVQESVLEGKRLYAKIAEPNVMIKVPATPSGYQIMQELFTLGISINATLIFSPEQAIQTLHALQKGKEQADEDANLQAVISIFVSRFDRKCDPLLPENLQSKLGIMNATAIYKIIQSHNIPYIRSLFASTSVKSDHLPASYYIDNLLFPNSINTAPLETIDAFNSNHLIDKKLPSQEELTTFFEQIKQQGIILEDIYQELSQEGLDTFKDSFRTLLQSLSA